MPSFSIRSRTFSKFSLFFSAKACWSYYSMSLQYFNHTKYFSPFAITTSLTKFSLASSIAFYKAFRSIFSYANKSCKFLSFSFLCAIMSLYLFLSLITCYIFSLYYYLDCSILENTYCFCFILSSFIASLLWTSASCSYWALSLSFYLCSFREIFSCSDLYLA